MTFAVIEMTPTGKRAAIKTTSEEYLTSGSIGHENMESKTPETPATYQSDGEGLALPRITPSVSSETNIATENMEEQGSKQSLDKQNDDDKKPSKLVSYSDINENDVLCGRGAGTNRHIGNQRFRELVQANQEAYLAAKVLDKSVIASVIVDTMSKRSPAGRFLKAAESGANGDKKKETLWYQISDRAAKDKTSQALRERAPEVRRRLGHLSPRSEYGSLSPIPTPSSSSRRVISAQDSPMQLPGQALSYLQIPAMNLDRESPPSANVARDNAEVTDNDVLCGRGGVTNCHVGNRRFRDLVKAHQPSYLAAPKMEKAKIARKIVHIIRAANPPGRFLQQKKKDGEWHDIGDTKAREKTSQALREKAPEVRSLYSAAAKLVGAKEGYESQQDPMQYAAAPKDSRAWPHPAYPPQMYRSIDYNQARDVFDHRDTSYNEDHRSGVMSPSLQDDGAVHITRLNGNDVILGNGAGANYHSGNIRFRNIVKDFQAAYASAATHEKADIAATIVDLIRQSVPSGRYLAEDPVEKGVWSDVGDQRATEKTSQALHESLLSSHATFPRLSINTSLDSREDSELPSDGRRVNSMEVSDNDVLLGRGAGVNFHMGNRRFRDLVMSHKPRYVTAQKLEKAFIAKSIVDYIHSSSPPGRFLLKDPEVEGAWIDAGEERAREKTSQALREKTNESRLPLSSPPPKRSYSQVAMRPYQSRSDCYSPSERAFAAPQMAGYAYPAEQAYCYASSGYNFPPPHGTDYQHFPASRPASFYASQPEISHEWTMQESMDPRDPSAYSSPGKRRRF